MKKECEYARKLLPRYLRGHVFRLQKARIERHLKQCAVCSSECQALMHTEVTRRFLKDLAPAEGVMPRMKEGFSGLGRLKKLFYRPLWIAVLAAVVAAAYYYSTVVLMPRRLDLELESIVKTAPSLTAPATAPSTTTASPAAAPSPDVAAGQTKRSTDEHAR